MELLCISTGMWIGALMMYLMIIRPLRQENENLKEIIHQQTKIGFYEELKEGEHE